MFAYIEQISRTGMNGSLSQTHNYKLFPAPAVLNDILIIAEQARNKR